MLYLSSGPAGFNCWISFTPFSVLYLDLYLLGDDTLIR